MNPVNAGGVGGQFVPGIAKVDPQCVYREDSEIIEGAAKTQEIVFSTTAVSSCAARRMAAVSQPKEVSPKKEKKPPPTQQEIEALRKKKEAEKQARALTPVTPLSMSSSQSEETKAKQAERLQNKQRKQIVFGVDLDSFEDVLLRNKEEFHAIRFCQNSVAPESGDGVNLVESITDNGWDQQRCMRAVRMPDRCLTTMDNRRLKAIRDIVDREPSFFEKKGPVNVRVYNHDCISTFSRGESGRPAFQFREGISSSSSRGAAAAAASVLSSNVTDVDQDKDDLLSNLSIRSDHFEDECSPTANGSASKARNQRSNARALPSRAQESNLSFGLSNSSFIFPTEVAAAAISNSQDEELKFSASTPLRGPSSPLRGPSSYTPITFTISSARNSFRIGRSTSREGCPVSSNYSDSNRFEDEISPTPNRFAFKARNQQPNVRAFSPRALESNLSFRSPIGVAAATISNSQDDELKFSASTPLGGAPITFTISSAGNSSGIGRSTSREGIPLGSNYSDSEEGSLLRDNNGIIANSYGAVIMKRMTPLGGVPPKVYGFTDSPIVRQKPPEALPENNGASSVERKLDLDDD